jgi:LysR family glycine cleavage system transcriptional activator
LVAERLFDADLFPVCAPRHAQRLKSPRQLKPVSLLRVRHAREDWPQWLRAAGLTGISAAGPTFEFYGQALQAACDGVGVSLGIRPYVDDDLRARRLVAPFKLSVPKSDHWFLIFKASRREEPAFVTFQRWITHTVQARRRLA